MDTSIYYYGHEIAFVDGSGYVYLTRANSSRLNIQQSYYDSYSEICRIEPSKDPDGICFLYKAGDIANGYTVTKDGYVIPGRDVPVLETTIRTSAVGRIVGNNAYDDVYATTHEHIIGSVSDSGSTIHRMGGLAALIIWINGTYWLVNSNNKTASVSARENYSNSKNTVDTKKFDNSPYKKVLDTMAIIRKLNSLGYDIPDEYDISFYAEQLMNGNQLGIHTFDDPMRAAERLGFVYREPLPDRVVMAPVVTDPTLLGNVKIMQAQGTGFYPNYYLSNPTKFTVQRKDTLFGLSEKVTLGKRTPANFTRYIYSDSFGAAVYEADGISKYEVYGVDPKTGKRCYLELPDYKQSVSTHYILSDSFMPDGPVMHINKWYFVRQSPINQDIIEVSTLNGDTEVMIGYATSLGTIHAVHMSRDGMYKGWNVTIGHTESIPSKKGRMMAGAAFIIMNADLIDICSHTVRTGAAYTDPGFAVENRYLNVMHSAMDFYNRLLPIKYANIDDGVKAQLSNLQNKILDLDLKINENRIKRGTLKSVPNDWHTDLAEMRRLNLNYAKIAFDAFMARTSHK